VNRKSEKKNDTERDGMTIFTGKGDNGTTGLFSGERVPKNHERIDAIGDIDELNSALGLLRVYLSEENEDVCKEIRNIQANLLYVGGLIATWRDSPHLKELKQLGKQQVENLEEGIDRLDKILPALNRFILPNGHPAAVWAQFARTVCRRAERKVVGLSVEVKVGKPPKQLRWVLAYLNRLSDYLFVLGRYCNFLTGIPDDF
jgi:cob(I)alamin adenosyltransferase